LPNDIDEGLEVGLAFERLVFESGRFTGCGNPGDLIKDELSIDETELVLTDDAVRIPVACLSAIAFS
jgi:hypothetical protein